MKVRPLKGFDAFDAVLKTGIRVTVGPIGLTVLVTSPSDAVNSISSTKATIAVGVAVGKRTVRRSVARVRLRRLLRESVREVTQKMSETLIEARVGTAVVMWRKPVNRPSDVALKDVQPHVEQAFSELIHRLARRSSHTGESQR